jgi:hypothetical protein
MQIILGRFYISYANLLIATLSRTQCLATLAYAPRGAVLHGARAQIKTSKCNITEVWLLKVLFDAALSGHKVEQTPHRWPGLHAIIKRSILLNTTFSIKQTDQLRN